MYNNHNYNGQYQNHHQSHNTKPDNSYLEIQENSCLDLTPERPKKKTKLSKQDKEQYYYTTTTDNKTVQLFQQQVINYPTNKPIIPSIKKIIEQERFIRSVQFLYDKRPSTLFVIKN